VRGFKWTQKVGKLEDNIRRILAEPDVSCLFLCEVGHMVDLISWELLELRNQQAARAGLPRADAHRAPIRDTTKVFFEELLARLGLAHFEVFADVPYVALVDTSIWIVKDHHRVEKMCSNNSQRAQHLLLEHRETGVTVRALNCHTPTSIANTPKKKEDTVRRMLTMCTDQHGGSGALQPTAVWVMGGDFNVGEGLLMEMSTSFVRRGRVCLSKAGRSLRTHAAQKSDFALSQGITLTHRNSSFGVCSAKPCCSDAHDCVLVVGEADIPPWPAADLADLHGVPACPPSFGSELVLHRLVREINEALHSQGLPSWLLEPTDGDLRMRAQPEGKYIDQMNEPGSCLFLAMNDPRSFGINAEPLIPSVGDTGLMLISSAKQRSGTGINNRRTNVIEALLNELEGPLKDKLQLAWELAYRAFCLPSQVEESHWELAQRIFSCDGPLDNDAWFLERSRETEEAWHKENKKYYEIQHGKEAAAILYRILSDPSDCQDIGQRRFASCCKRLPVVLTGFRIRQGACTISDPPDC
jgi:hypothetical protein